MAPEVVEGNKYNEQVDVFSTGSICFEVRLSFTFLNQNTSISKQNLTMSYDFVCIPIFQMVCGHVGITKHVKEDKAKGKGKDNRKYLFDEHCPEFLKFIEKMRETDPSKRPDAKKCVEEFQKMATSLQNLGEF